MASVKLECPTTLVSGDLDWERDKEAIADTFIRRAEQVIPGPARTTSSCAESGRRWTWSATPATPTAPSPGGRWFREMLSRQRPPQRTVVPGLYAAGQWTTPNAGLPWVMVSGYNTAGMVLRDALGRDEWQEYAAPVPATEAAEASEAPRPPRRRSR